MTPPSAPTRTAPTENADGDGEHWRDSSMAATSQRSSAPGEPGWSAGMHPPDPHAADRSLQAGGRYLPPAAGDLLGTCCGTAGNDDGEANGNDNLDPQPGKAGGDFRHAEPGDL